MKIKKNFNMVEIVIALGVAAIGLTGIMVLFPIATSANKDAKAEAYATNLSELFISFQTKELENKDNAWWNNPSNATDSTSIGYPGPFPLNETGVFSGTEIITDYLWQSTVDTQVFGAKVTTTVNSKEVIELACIIYVWQDSIYNESGLPVFSSNADATLRKRESDSIARAICVEISWPEHVPYAQRKKRTFYREVFNKN